MTLIAGFPVNGFPMIFGDALLSGPSESGLERLPVGEGIRAAFEHWSWRPLGLCQKIALIGDNVAVAWSGPRHAARALLRDWVAEASDHALTRAEIESRLSGLDDCQANRDLQLIGMVFDGSAISGFTYNIAATQQTSAGPIVIAGSGTADFLSDLGTEGLPKPDPHLSNFDQAMATALTVAGRMLALELHGGWNLPNFYGGAYEAVFLHGGRFTKMRDVTYAFWIASPHSDGLALSKTPVRLIRHLYVDDLLVYRTAAPSMEGEQWVIAEDHPHVIGPVYGDARLVDLSQAMGSFHSEFVCNLVICTDAQGVNRAVYSRVDARRGSDQPVSFTVDETGGLRLTMSRNGLYDLVDGVRPFYEERLSTCG